MGKLVRDRRHEGVPCPGPITQSPVSWSPLKFMNSVPECNIVFPKPQHFQPLTYLLHLASLGLSFYCLLFLGSY